VIEREWREASDMRRATLSLAIILAVAAALRFFALGSGIPFAVGVDEPEIVNRAVTMMRSGDFNPHFFDYPTLYMYVQLVVAVARFMAGAMAGEWSSLSQVTSADFFLWGRATTAAFGTATVFLVYAAGLRWGTRTALLGAGLLAVFPLHVRESHFVLTDVPTTFFATLTFLLTLRAHEQQQMKAFALAGAAAGLAAATKYPGGLAIVMPLMAIWMTPGARPSRIVGALAIVGGSGAAFLIAAPYTFLDLPAFLNGFAHLMTSYNGKAPGDPAWLVYFKHLRNSVQWPALLLMLAGAVLAVVRAIRGSGRVRWALAVTFPVLYFVFISRACWRPPRSSRASASSGASPFPGRCAPRSSRDSRSRRCFRRRSIPCASIATTRSTEPPRRHSTGSRPMCRKMRRSRSSPTASC
jgi:4-amino-4-deoxy-L-arabinose transferase-like glycosyltransferase